MATHSNREDRGALEELLSQYEQLRTGGAPVFIDEESFERLIDHFQQQEQLDIALEAASFGVERYPYSSSLLIRKADILILHRRYKEALKMLDRPSCWIPAISISIFFAPMPIWRWIILKKR